MKTSENGEMFVYQQKLQNSRVKENSTDLKYMKNISKQLEVVKTTREFTLKFREFRKMKFPQMHLLIKRRKQNFCGSQKLVHFEAISKSSN